ncbi:Uncharacterised protein [Mycobacteroides abscessus subsp. massiliense]|nr:Uncharacterised protein [Mycobacteroides abscessus subsp. massiliense]
MAPYVVRVRITAVLVVGRHDVRAELPDNRDQLGDRFLDRHQGERIRWQRRQRVTLRQSRIHVTQPAVPHAELRGGLGHLLAADGTDVRGHLRTVHGRVQDVAAFTAGKGHHHDLIALGGIPCRGGGALTCLVIGVGVHRHQSQSGHPRARLFLVRSLPSREDSPPPSFHLGYTRHTVDPCSDQRTDTAPSPRRPAADAGSPSH